MRNIDFSSWQALLLSLFGLALVTLIGVGLRLVAMQTIQQRRERENRQINERLRTLIAAYKTLGGSFTGNLAVDPRHLRELRRSGESTAAQAVEPASSGDALTLESGSDRARRVRDAVEAALSDTILLGTEEQVRLAANAAAELAAGRHVHTHDLVVSLRDFIRGVLDLDAVRRDVEIPRQGPARPSAGGGKGGGGNRDDARQGGGRGGGGGGAGLGAGLGLGVGGGLALDDDHAHHE
ncbi:MAG TPA: hypothetical protein VFV97_11380 [Rhodanobacteraceae bacterium]|nr:hypothetical protein [Rhodanobacteraceae bacterium]